jgi:ribonuclease D
MTYSLIADHSSLEQAAPRIRGEDRIALDCEAAGFHRYTDSLCLVQLSTPKETFLIDPMEMDPSDLLRPILEDPAIQVVMHGADFDLRLLHRDLGIRLQGLFDTQTAATLLGVDSIGLASVLEEFLGVSLSKAHQRADWGQRPLPEKLLAYAADDTRHLLALRDLLAHRLGEAGRSEWAEEEFRTLEDTQWEPDDADPVTRVKGARRLSPRELAGLRVALDWRDRIARARDRAPFRVVGDSVLSAVVERRPASVEELADLKGMSARLARSRGKELLAALEEAHRMPEEALEAYPRNHRDGPGRPSPEEEAMANAIRDLRSAKAKELGLDRGVLLSNAQIAEIVRAQPRRIQEVAALPQVRAWQAELLGRDIVRILSR